MNLKNSNTAGYDKKTSRILKMGSPIISILLTHAINTSIRENKFPETLKIARVLPILKPDKNKKDPDGYRPISNLHTAEKVFEEHLKVQLMEHLEKNEIIHPNHHGGLRNKSTQTAKAAIDVALARGYEDDRTCALLCTDLSSCFDTIDHGLLLRKMEFYRIKGKENNIKSSYLENRVQFVQVDV